MGFYYETVFRKNGMCIRAGLACFVFDAAGWKEQKMFRRGGNEYGGFDAHRGSAPCRVG
jgi:hypothetical protein